MGRYAKPLVLAIIGVFIILFGFTADWGEGAKECAGKKMGPGDTCVGASGAYGYADIEAKDAENRHNKQLITSVIGGVVIIGAAGFAVRTATEDVQDVAARRRSAAEERARAAQDRWLRPADPGELEESSGELLGGGRVDLYTHALCYTTRTRDGHDERWVRWVRWDQVTRVEDNRGSLSSSPGFTVRVGAEGNVEPLQITGFTGRGGHPEFATQIEQIAVQAATPKVHEALNTTGVYHLPSAEEGGILGLAGLTGLTGFEGFEQPSQDPRTDLRLTGEGFVYRQHNQDHVLPWARVTELAMSSDALSGRRAKITRRDGASDHFAANTTTDVAAFQLAHRLWSSARRRS